LQLTVILLACNNTRPHVHWKTNTHKVLQLTVKLRLTHCNTAYLQLSCFWNARVMSSLVFIPLLEGCMGWGRRYYRGNRGNTAVMGTKLA